MRFPVERARRRAAAARRAEIRRRRAALVVLPLLVAGFILASGPGGVSTASRSGAPEAVVLQAGQTLWDVAERYAPAGVDPRAYVDAVLEKNGITGVPAPGERLDLP